MNKKIAQELINKIPFQEWNRCGCWIPTISTRSVRYEGKMVSLVYLSYVLSGSKEPFRFKQEVTRKCGDNNCFNPEHLVFDEMERFWMNVGISEDGCWEWLLSTDGGGYGVFVSYKYGREKAHRISYMERVGDIPNGIMVLHECDNPSCVNPRHLFLGTNQDNMKDKVSKNRQSRLNGKDNGRAKLDMDDVKQMRDDYESGKFSYRELVNKYRISQTQVARIVKNESWSWA